MRWDAILFPGLIALAVLAGWLERALRRRARRGAAPAIDLAVLR